MTVAIVHYHLHRGGVRSVIRSQSQALAASGVNHVILTGSPPDGSETLPAIHLPELNYTNAQNLPEPEKILAALDEKAGQALGSAPDLWHFHNHSLGKNRAVSELPGLLAQRGSRLLLQIHDFAADGRPGNFEMLKDCHTVYPIASHAHYAFINSRDRRFLVNSGLPKTLCHLLPNAVSPPPRKLVVQEHEENTVLYPVRGIRRKNLGELCLLSALAPPNTRFAVTLSPENPQWRPIHDRWEQFAGELDLPVEFGVVGKVAPVPGTAPTFNNWLAHSTHLVTTSIAEGFGLAFLEPLALGLPLLGRDLPEITCDFKEHGVQLGNLYQRLPIPLDWIDLDDLRRKLEHSLTEYYRSYERRPAPDVTERAMAHMTQDGSVDFGNLPESIQEQVIRKARAEPTALATTAWLAQALQARQPASPVEAISPFGPEAYQAALSSVYTSVRESGISGVRYHRREAILDQFLNPARFHFLRT